MGTSHEEYQNLAKKNQLDDLHLGIIKLRDRVGAIQRNQDYAKVAVGCVKFGACGCSRCISLLVLFWRSAFIQEKSLTLQSSIESSNQRATWVSVLQVRCNL
jgi:hypothetical protein